MAKIIFVFVVMASVLAIQGFPTDGIADAALKGDWDEVHRLIQQSIMKKYNLQPVIPQLAPSVDQLQPVNGGHVYGESEFTFTNTNSENGRPVVQSGGMKTINRDGVVETYQIKPNH